MNRVEFIGKLGSDPEIKYFESGNSIANVSIADNFYSKGEQQTIWLPLKIWGALGVYLANHARKGSTVKVTGSLESETWTDRQSGSQRSKTILNVDWVDILSSEGGSATPGKTTAQTNSEPIPNDPA